jgi:glutamate/aspartate transport system substrate-binding protein
MKRSLTVMALSLAVGSAMASDTLRRIQERGSVAMGVRDSSVPLSYTLGGGRYVGFQVDVCHRVIDDIRKRLGLARLGVQYMAVSAQNRIPLVKNGAIDMECGSTTNNAARQKQVAFSMTTYVEHVRIAVKANSGITSIAQLNGKVVATTTGTTEVQLIRRHERGLGVEFRNLYGRDHADSFLLLESGRADAFVMDSHILAGLIARARNPGEFRIVGEALSVEPIAIVLRRDDPAFKKAVDDGVKALMKSGEMAALYDKWFTQSIAPANVRVGLPAGEATRAAWAAPNDLPQEELARR